MTVVGHLINGQMTTESTNALRMYYNPSTWRGQQAGGSCVTGNRGRRRLTAAQAAYPAWRNTPAIKRARVMFKFKDLLEQNADKICAANRRRARQD